MGPRFALIALLAGSTAPAVASGQTADAGRPVGRRVSFGGFVGYESDTWDGWTLRADGEMAFQPLAPKLALSGVGSIGFSRLSADFPNASETVTIVKAVPAARFSLAVAPGLAAYGDAGLGLYYARLTRDLNVPFFGVRRTTDSNVSVVARVGVGGFYAVNPQLRLGVEVDLTPYLGDLDSTTWSLSVGAMFGL